MAIEALTCELAARRGEAAVPATRPEPFVVVARRASELEPFVREWRALAAAAAEPNVFYEPWMVLPAIEAFGAQQDLLFILIFTPPISPGQPRLLSGFFPLQRQRTHHGLPVRGVRLWKYLHCFLSTPLVRAACVEEVLKTFFEWLEASPEVGGILELEGIAHEGGLQQRIVYGLNGSARPNRSTFRTRALFRPAQDADTYLKHAVSRKRRKEYRRLANRLSETGRIEYRELGPEADVGQWIEDFLDLEASGWKGREGGALAADPKNRRFFTEVLTGAFQHRQLMMLALCRDGRPIAMKCNFLTGAGSFAFKIAFDEACARYSPGALLELENIHRLHDRHELRWMDSCADSGHPMIEGLWSDRRTVETLVVSTRSGIGGLIVSALPLLKWIHHRVVRPLRTEARHGTPLAN